MFRCLVASIAVCFAAANPLGQPTFEQSILLEEKGETSAGVSTGDLNGDGHLDLVLAKGRHWPLHNRVLLNDGKGTYTASNLSAQPDRTYSTALADIDLDGDLDIVVSNDSPDRKLIYKNDGKANFTESGTFGEARWPTRYITLADLNADRYPDIIVANRGFNSFVCFNDQAGRFPDCQALSTQSATSITAADFDGDGALDLFVPHRDGGQSMLLWNNGKGIFTTSTPIGDPLTHARMGAVADLNGDGLLDLAFIEEAKKASFFVLNRGKRLFSTPSQLPGPPSTPYALAISDLNRDSQPEVIVGYVESPGSIYWNQNKGRTFEQSRWNDGKGQIYGLAFADVNKDSWPDIISARSGAPNAIWLSKLPPRL